MRKKHLISITLIILLTTSSCGILNVLKFSEMPRFLLGGIQVDEPDNEKWVKTLKDAGMNTVPVTVYAKQGDWNTDNLWYDKTNIYVIDEIRTAKKMGLDVYIWTVDDPEIVSKLKKLGVDGIITNSPITSHVRCFFDCSSFSESAPPMTMLKAANPIRITASGAAK